MKKGDKVELHLAVTPRIVLGEHRNKGKAAILYGRLVWRLSKGYKMNNRSTSRD